MCEYKLFKEKKNIYLPNIAINPREWFFVFLLWGRKTHLNSQPAKAFSLRTPKSKAWAMAMAILALPLFACFLKHHTYRLSIHSRKPLSSSFCNSPYRRHFHKTCSSAITPFTTLHHSSTDSKNDDSKSSVLTFQQAIQRLQVIFLILKYLFLVYFSAKEWRVVS